MPDWSITIVEGADGKTRFAPDQTGVKPGGALQAGQDDLVSWNNTTDQTHQPWPTKQDFTPLPAKQVQRGSALYLSDPIPPGESSRPSYNVAQPPAPPSKTPPSKTPSTKPTPPTQWTVFYFCKNHPNAKSERGTIRAKVVPVINIPE